MMEVPEEPLHTTIKKGVDKMSKLKYWQVELPKIKIIGKIRLAYYEKAEVLQFNLLHQENDGTITIGKTICLYKESIHRGNLDSLGFLIDILHLWRKKTRALDLASAHYDTSKEHCSADLETLVNVLEVEQGDFTYSAPIVELENFNVVADHQANLEEVNINDSKN